MFSLSEKEDRSSPESQGVPTGSSVYIKAVEPAGRRKAGCRPCSLSLSLCSVPCEVRFQLAPLAEFPNLTAACEASLMMLAFVCSPKTGPVEIDSGAYLSSERRGRMRKNRFTLTKSSLKPKSVPICLIEDHSLGAAEMNLQGHHPALPESRRAGLSGCGV